MKKTFVNAPKLSILNDEDIDLIAAYCNALGDKKRLIILKELQNPPFKIALTDMARKLNMPITSLVHHVEILEKARECAIDFVKNYDIKDFKTLHEQVLKHNLFRG